MEEEMVVEDNVTEEEEEEEEVEYSFTAYEIDLEYEFDAARFFDFSRVESPLEARQAEVWFDSAGSYPPSPFVLKLVPKEQILKENIQISPKSKGVEDASVVHSDSDVAMDEEIPAVSMNDRDDVQDRGTSTTQQYCGRMVFKNPSERSTTGLTLHCHMENRADSKARNKFSMKPGTSTLMKPTASHLAKQNNLFRSGHHRSIFEKTSNSSTSMNGVENQAAKRQKLEGGLLRKVEGASQLQQNNFVHKAPKREGLVDGSMPHTKPRITIPREPDLETAHRAQRTRPKSTKDEETSAVGGFKALPLNRKILQAPSLIPKRSTPCLPVFQEFHLKTSERAMQHSSAVPNSRAQCDHSDKDLHKHASNLTSECGNRESSRTSTINTSRRDGTESSYRFKALALNKKILESKGDVGVFRNSKKETTVPMEFNFHTGTKGHQNPPIELFSKLSLASGAQRTANFESKLPQSINLSLKGGSKENRWECSLHGNEMKHSTIPKLSLLSRKQQVNVDEGANAVNIAAGINWSKDIR